MRELLRHPIFFISIILSIISSCTPVSKVPKNQEQKIENESWKFVAFGDSRGQNSENSVNVAILEKLVADIIQQEVDLVMFTGDICYGHANRKDLGDKGALEDLKKQMLLFRNTIKPLYEHNIDVYLVRGNHESTQYYPDLPGTPDHRPIWPDTKKIWDEVFSGPYQMPQNGPENEKNVTFYVNHKNALLLGLDLYTARDNRRNEDGSIPKPSTKRVDQVWLNEVLKEHKDIPHIFAFTHEPAFKVDHRDCMQGDDSYGLDYSVFRDSFWQSLGKAGASVYFCGHDHGYALAKIKGPSDKSPMYQMVVGTAGAGTSIQAVYDGYNGEYQIESLDQSQSYGFVLGKVNGRSLSLTYRYLDQEGLFKEQAALELD